jgi:hypothetical protein
MLANHADLDQCVIIELEAEPAGDVDFDADQGAMLVLPTKILDCARIDRAMAARVAAVSSGGDG